MKTINLSRFPSLSIEFSLQDILGIIHLEEKKNGT